MTLSTDTIRQRLQIRRATLARAERETLERAITHARTELAVHEERVGLLLEVFDVECAQRFTGRVQYTDDAAANLAAERQEVTRLAAAIRGLQRAMEGAK